MKWRIQADLYLAHNEQTRLLQYEQLGLWSGQLKPPPSPSG